MARFFWWSTTTVSLTQDASIIQDASSFSCSCCCLRATPTPSPPPPAPPLQPPPPFLDLIILLRHNRQPYRCFSCSSECTNSGVRPAGSNCFVLPTPITHGWCSTAQSRKTTAERKLQAPAFPFPCILSSCG